MDAIEATTQIVVALIAKDKIQSASDASVIYQSLYQAVRYPDQGTPGKTR